jgi:DNA polymerase I
MRGPFHPAPVPKPTLFLIDGSSQMYRAYHAIRGLTGPDGRSTNAVYGFVTMLRKLLNDHRPQYVAASFDLPGPTFRSGLAADYKANRAPMPPDLAEQVPWVHQACESLGVPVLTREGFEADDVIGTLARSAAAEGVPVAIVTGDKDFFQLVGDDITVFNPRDDGTWYDAAGVRDKFGVAPDQVVDTLALMGDAIDNVKGVPGIGDKGARDLIGAHGTLDRLLDVASTLPQKKYRDALTAHADLARHSRELLRIRTDVPLPPFDIEAFRYGGARRADCYALFTELGFRSLVTEFAPTADTVTRDYAVVGSREELASLVESLRAAGRVAFRVIPDGPAPLRAEIVGVAFSGERRHARYVPIGHTALDGVARLDPDEALATMKALFKDRAVSKIGHDLKSDLLLLERRGISAAGLQFDTMLASYLLDATHAGHQLEESALTHLGYKAQAEEEICGRGPRALPIAQVPVDAVLAYACERADLAGQLAERLAPQLAQEGLETLFRNLEMPLVPVLAAIEREGVRLDGVALASQSQRIERDLATRSARIFELAGETFNINSPKQLSAILFEKLKLPSLKKTGKTRTTSTAVEVLEELALVHELPRQILEWRALQKLKGTYIDALPQLVDPDTGRVHTSFNQAVASTGRLSSSDPNLQNIPIRTDLGREIRRAFIADPGNVLISADYSQIELRVLAHLSGDEALIGAFHRGEDIHEQTAARVFGPDSGLDPYELRRRAKIINYALLYGKTPFTLARDIGVTQQAAQEFIDAYFEGFPRVGTYLAEIKARARETGEVRTLFGRRLLVPELTSHNAQIRAEAERKTVNLPIQGTAADILKRAMIDVHRRLRERHDEARMILTVHDELLFEVPRAQAAEVAELVRDVMEHAVTLDVPLTVDVGIGENWKEAKR